MEPFEVKLIDATGRIVATAHVQDKGAYFGGTVDVSQTPNALLDLFREFEEIVNGQVLSLVDEMQDKFEAYGIRALFPDNVEVCITDLQVYPAGGTMSFIVERHNNPLSISVNGTQANYCDTARSATP